MKYLGHGNQAGPLKLSEVSKAAARELKNLWIRRSWNFSVYLYQARLLSKLLRVGAPLKKKLGDDQPRCSTLPL